MNKKDIAEIKRRFTKNGCTFTKMCGCYVDGEHNKITTFTETFLNLEEEEFYKYLDIAKKVLSGTLGNNLLELEFPMEQEALGGKQQALMALKESALKNEAMLDAFYDLVIENYSHVGNYLILVFHDAYDIIKKTKDNLELDESEEVYEYLLCAICPVDLSKPALGYQEDGNCIRSLIRDWVVGMPDTGFVFPAFSERSMDVHNVMFYTKNAKEPHTEFVEGALGCAPRLTATEKKMTFADIVKNVLGDNEEGNVQYMDIHGNINEMVELKRMSQEEEEKSEAEPIMLTPLEFSDILANCGVPEDQSVLIETSYEETFGEDLPEADKLVEPKLIEANQRRKERLELIRQVEALKQQLEQKKEEAEIVVQVQDEKANEVYVTMLDGRKCLVIPMEEEELVKVNGRDCDFSGEND